jgi:predicted DNA-binding mobile mystery protein A
MKRSRLQLEQLEAKMAQFKPGVDVAIPPTGWIKALRTALGMSMQQLANRLSISKQSVQNMESRESEGSITIKSLREVAKAMEMELVYGLVPQDGSLDALIDRKASELATKIVLRTSHTMKLEDQKNSDSRLRRAVEERTQSLKYEMPKTLWD